MMKRKSNTGKVIEIRLSTIIAFIASIVIILTAITNTQKSRQIARVMDSELLRAMNYEEFADGSDAVNGTNNVKFSAFFLRDIDGDGYAEKLKGTCKHVGTQDIMYMEIIVQTEGYLKDGKIEINGENFYLQTALPKDQQLKQNYIGNNITQLEFNNLLNGTQKLMAGFVRSGNYLSTSTKYAAIGKNINNYSRNDNKIILTGTYVAGDETETEIRKEIDLTVDWYGETEATIYTTSQTRRDIENRIDEENQTIKLDFTVNTEETKKELNIYSNYVEGTIPELNGYAPIEVKQTSGGGVFEYLPSTKKFTITKTAVTDENGIITSSVPTSNTYGIQVVYPLEAYLATGEEAVTIKIPVETYYEGYNNPNNEFNNPYRSNVAKGIITASYYPAPPATPGYEAPASIDITVGKYVYNQFSSQYYYMVSKAKPLRIYNEISDEETEDTYIVRWNIYTGPNGDGKKIILKETAQGTAQKVDEFIKEDTTRDSMENITTNVGIYFSGADNALKADGEIKVYDDETGILLATFTKKDWSTYTESNTFKFETPVKHIRVETSEANAKSSLYVYSVKNLDDEYITTHYTREQFDNLQYIESNLTGKLGETSLGIDTGRARYEAPYSVAIISLSKDVISTQETEKNENIYIDAKYNAGSNQVGWINGSFLVKLPAGILSIDINNISINNGNVRITSYEVIEQNGSKFIKINTANETEQQYRITIDCDITPDPRIATTNGTIELYASNEAGADYYYKAPDIYDVNDNLNVAENVNKRTTSINLVAPSSLLTNQTLSEFDGTQTVIVSPDIADVKPKYGAVNNETNTAKIGVQIKNNYAGIISEVKIIGKIPFSGNTYVLSQGSLNSEFTTTMQNTGIQLPAALQGLVDVYYTENTNPNKNIEDVNNGYKKANEVSDWSSIKSYIIDFKDVEIPQGTEYVFYYTVEIPQGVDFNKVAYSHHGVYFSLHTESGKYRTQTEPNKIGIRIAEKYNLELTKYQTGKNNIVQGATYRVTEVLQNNQLGEAITQVTDAQGKLTINNLYAEKTYEIQEIKTPEDYELNSNAVRIIGHVNQTTGEFTIEKLSGTTRDNVTYTHNTGEDYKVRVNVEDEAKARLKITKTEQGTQTRLQGVKYKITGEGLPANGRLLTTNNNGEITLKGLKVGEEYTLEETKAKEGYYIEEGTIKFRINNNNGTYTIQLTDQGEVSNLESSIKTTSITEENNLPLASIELEDEPIPTYTLKIDKIKKITEVEENSEPGGQTPEIEHLAGAKFKLYKDEKEIGEYITDANGILTINNLYQYVLGRPEEAKYTLKEVLPPTGYTKVKDITFIAEEIAGELILHQELTDGQKEKTYTVNGSTITLTVEDTPSFKLTKRDGETNALLPNVKFAIYNTDNGEKPATNSKGEIIGTKETINGKEYYTVTTNAQGEITLDLPEGFYKAVEVQADAKYDIENKVYRFGVGASREPQIRMDADWARSIGGTNVEYIQSVAETTDGGYIAGGSSQSAVIQVGNETLTNAGGADGMIIKYDAQGEVEWARSIGGTNYDQIYSVAGTGDGGAIAGGSFQSTTIQVGNETLTNAGNSDGMIIKYDSSGNVEWARSIGGTKGDTIQSVAETSDGGAIVGGVFSSSSIQVGNETLTGDGSYDGMIIKYNAQGNAEWARSIGGTSDDRIQSVAETSDGGYIAGGYFSSTVIQVGNETLTGDGSYDGMIIKYNSSGNVEWARSIGGTISDHIYSVAETSDGGIIAGGKFLSSSIQVGNETLTNTGSTYTTDGMIIKYDREGEVEWARSIGGTGDDQINSVTGTSDGGVLAGGCFSSSRIQVGSEILLNTGSYTDGMIIKYDAQGNVEWAKNIGGTNNDYIQSVAETSDEGYIVGGYFQSAVIQVENKILRNTNNSTSYTDGMIIKYTPKETPTIVYETAESIGGTNTEYIYSVSGTSGGGYIAGGHFNSAVIQLGNETLTNAGSNDGMIIKYDAQGEVEWTRRIGGTGNEYIRSVAETSDGGAIVGGRFSSTTIQVGNETLTRNGDYDGMIIKYDSSGNVQWARSIGGTGAEQIESVVETSDGGYIAGGNFKSAVIQVGNETLNLTSGSSSSTGDGIIIKYDSSGNVEWARSIGGTSTDLIQSVAATSDGGYIAGGYFSSAVIQVGNETLTRAGTGSSDGIIIKYDSSGEVEWARSIGGTGVDSIQSVAETSDGGYIAGGYFEYSIQVGNETLTNAGSYDGMIIKYSSSGEVEWARSIGETGSEEIQSVAETSDGGYIAGGYFRSSSIQVGNETLTNATTNGGNYDGMIIKYDSSGNVEWARSIGGGTSNDYIQSVAEIETGRYVAGGYFAGSIEVGNETLTSNGNNDGMIMTMREIWGAAEQSELEVMNERKEVKITTDVKEIDGIKGGSISGEDKNPYESVKYGDTSEKEIKMIPDENYEIIGITVNGEEWPFTPENDDTYTMPQFTNMTEDKHIVVTYSLKSNKITINKVDSATGDPLTGATFRLEQLDERAEPTQTEIGTLTNNSNDFYELDTTNEITGRFGTLTNNGTYYFVEQNGTYVPTNSKTYQLANGGSAGIGSSYARSYIPIDLSGLTGKYMVVVNASVESQTSYDYGWVNITQNTNTTSYNTSQALTNRLWGTQASKDYISAVLNGNQTYYLHFGYYKNGSTDTGADQMVINSVKLYGTKTVKYNFVDNAGKYESTNQGKVSTTSNSYIPIDLSSLTGKYNLIVNAQVSSDSSDYGYATITESTTAPAYSSNTTTNRRFIYISGTSGTNATPTDYTIELEAGRPYYLHLGYYKNASTDAGDDKFTVNSVRLTLSGSDLYPAVEVSTNSDGQAITQLPFGKYKVTEIETPEGYFTNENIADIEFKGTQGAIHEFTIEDERKAKVIVEHYYKDKNGQETQTKVAEDDIIYGKLTDDPLTEEKENEYTTSPHMDLERYTLEKDNQDEYVIPANATGEFTVADKIVKYYYVDKEIPLTVHHYIEGTETPVPLANGTTAEDEHDSDYEGEAYTTSEIADQDLDETYELAEIPENAEGIYEGDEVVVTYLYKKATRTVTINKYDEDGTTPLEGVKFDIDDTVNEDAPIVGEMTPSNTYYFVQQGNKWVSNNQGIAATANSYMKIDLTHATTSKTVTVNAQVSSRASNDYGYATITENTTVPAYNSTTGRFIYIAGTSTSVTTPTDYTTTLQPGKVYYLHLGYRKASTTSSGTDTFTINSITVEGEGTYQAPYETNANGQIQVELEAGTHKLTEIETLPSHKIPANPDTQFTVTKSGRNVVNINNDKKYRKVTINKYDEDGETPLEGVKFFINKDENKMVTVGDLTNNGTYYFKTTEDGKYISNNQGKSATANSYIQIDTTKAKQNVTLTVNAQVSSRSGYDYGYATITESTTAPAYSNSTGRFIYISGTTGAGTTPTDYTTTLTKGKVYYLHLGYRKAATTSSGADTFTINSITVEGEGKEYTTDVNGQIMVDLEEDTYKVTETETLEGFVLPENPTSTVTVGRNGAELNVTNEREITTGRVIVHHYIQGTTTPVPLAAGGTAPDEITEDDIGETYTTSPNANIADEYELVLPGPANATGTYAAEDTVVIYYYKIKDPVIESSITKTSTTARVTNASTKIPYAINYTATVDDYRGDATVTIVDTLPYQIDTTESTLNGGVYNSTARTITWTENIEDIDTYTSGEEEEITITKNIELLYTNVDETVANIENSVTGTIVLDDPTFTDTATATKTIPTEYLVDLTINKVWSDNETQAQRRPASIVLQVKNGNTVVQNYTLNTATETSHKFTGLAKYDNNHQAITYTVDEVEVNANDLKFYTKSAGTVANVIENSVENPNEKQATITNTFTKPTDKVQITVNKTWVDNETQAQRRPVSLVFQVKNGATVVDQYTLTTATETSHIFTNLDKYNDNGEEITYTVDEAEVNAGDLQFYTKSVGNVTGGDSKTATITNTFTMPQDKVQITVNKTWVDTPAQQNKRPNGVKFVVKNGNTVVQNYTLNVAGDSEADPPVVPETSHTFTNLAKYNSNGQEITYTVDEEEVNTDDLKFYTKSVGSLTGGDNKSVTVTNTFTVPNDTVTRTATKTWDDANKGRISSVQLVLTGNGVNYTHTVNSSNANATNNNIWEYEFTNLPKYDSNGDEIQYVLTENAVTAGQLDKYIGTVTDLNVTNKLIIKDSEIQKTGTNTLTAIDGTVEYTINYEADLDKEYTNTATITITDTLPYKIDTGKTYNLNGGKYDETAQTIIWKAEYNPTTNKVMWKKWQGSSWVDDTEVTLNEQTGLANVVNLTKAVTLVYKDMDKGATLDSFTNQVEGKIELANGVHEEVQDTHITTLDLKENVEINKIWIDGRRAHTTNELKAMLKIYKEIDGQVAQEVTTTHASKLSATDVEDEQTSKQDRFTATWTNLPQYERVDTDNDSTPDTWKRITYYVQETVPTGYTASYANVGNAATDKVYNNGTITNTLNFSLNVQKGVTGNLAETSKYFTFTITLKNSDNTTYTENIASVTGATDWTKVQDGQYTFKLKHNDNISLTLPIGTKYTIEETQESGYTTTLKITKTQDNTQLFNNVTRTASNQELNENQTVQYTNSKEESPNTGIFGNAGEYIVLTILAILSIVVVKFNRK